MGSSASVDPFMLMLCTGGQFCDAECSVFTDGGSQDFVPAETCTQGSLQGIDGTIDSVVDMAALLNDKSPGTGAGQAKVEQQLTINQAAAE